MQIQMRVPSSTKNGRILLLRVHHSQTRINKLRGHYSNTRINKLRGIISRIKFTLSKLALASVRCNVPISLPLMNKLLLTEIKSWPNAV